MTDPDDEPLTHSRKRPCNLCPFAQERSVAAVMRVYEPAAASPQQRQAERQSGRGPAPSGRLLCLSSGCLEGQGTLDYFCKGYADNVERLTERAS